MQSSTINVFKQKHSRTVKFHSFTLKFINLTFFCISQKFKIIYTINSLKRFRSNSILTSKVLNKSNLLQINAFLLQDYCNTYNTCSLSSPFFNTTHKLHHENHFFDAPFRFHHSFPLTIKNGYTNDEPPDGRLTEFPWN